MHLSAQAQKYMMRHAKGTEILLTAVCAMVVVSPCTGQIEEKEVVVIGGGIAGLAAARLITNQGRGNFTVRVFEARRERYGGRVWTDKLKHPKARGLEVDFGAFALNMGSPITNPLLNLTRDLELETAALGEVQFVVPWAEQRYYAGEELHDAFSAASEACILKEAVNRTRTEGEDLSVRAAVDRELNERGVDPLHLHSLLLHSLDSYQSPDYSAHLYQPHALDFGYKQVLLDGMGELLDRLASGTEDERPLKISLRTAVRQVKVDRSKDKVILRLKDGSQVTVDEVVLAVPAPVIARGDLLFEPPLPQNYATALKNMGMVRSNKVIVEFDAPFWPGDYGVFFTAVREEAEEGCLQFWVNIHRVLGIPVLAGFLYGQHASKVEGLSEADLHHLVLEKLQRTFGEKSVSSENIVSIKRSAWVSDPWGGASSTYPSVGDSAEMWDTFAEPWCPHVHFAGEHTLFRHHGTLHGAYISGQRAAEQILSGHCERKAAEEERRRKAERKRRAKQNETDRTDGQGTDEPDEENNDTDEQSKTTEGDVKDEL
ncbi:hypothetical protein ACOMHN_059237 [Nucella lapillus]